MAEDAWNTRDPEKVSLAYTEDCIWRNRDTFFQGREAIVRFLREKWDKETEYRLVKELFAFEGNRIAVCFQYEFKDATTGSWYRAYGNENWDFAENGQMKRRQASINNVAILEGERRFFWALGPRPSDFPGLTELEKQFGSQSFNQFEYKMERSEEELHLPRFDFDSRWESQKRSACAYFETCPAEASFVVQHRAVLLRSKPSVKVRKLVKSGWVQLTRESSQQAGAAGKIAWALINGEVGLGVLLRPLKPGETPKAMEEVFGMFVGDVEVLDLLPCQDIYTGALEFEVVFKSVSVRRRPRVTAKSVGIVKEGDRIFGYPKDNWLQTSKKYRQKDPGWIRMDGTDLGHGPLLQCTSLKPQMTKCFAEALLITWQQLPVKSALYTLEWMGQDKKTKAVALDKTRLTTGKIQGLAADSTYYVRVIALVMVPGIESSHPKSMCAQICSDWVEAQTGAPVDTVEQTSMTFDPLARIRGRCNSCKHCECFILSKYSYLMHLDQVLCRRCGCACTSHEIVGEYGKSQAQWAKENAQRRQREDQRRAGNKKPSVVPEIPCLPWQPDDSPAGVPKANYVIQQVKQARNFYETLGVKPSAPAKDIRNAYRQIALRIHPDKVCPGGETDSDLITAAEAVKQPETIDLCDTKGCILEDDHRFASDQVLYCIGISLGAPRTVQLEVRDHRTGARLYLNVLDTVSMESLRKKVARELQLKEKEIQVGHQKFTGKGSTRRFEAFPTDELLNGRRTIYINGNSVLIYLNLEQALQLQRDLIVAYSQPQFQKELDSLLHAHPLPESVTQMKFREAFGKLVRNAQKDCLRKWGFEGDFAAQNMMTAFGKVGHTPEVYSLSLEIDKLLRITSGGMIAAPLKPKKEEQAVPKVSEQQSTQEATKQKSSKSPVTITIRQAVDEENQAPAPPLKVTVPADATMRKVKQAIAEKLGMKRSTAIKLVFDLHGRAAKLRKTSSTDSGMTFASFKDDEQIGLRRELLVLGADLSQVGVAGKPSLGNPVVVTIREAESSREAQVMVYPCSTMHDVKISVAKRLQRWDIFQKARLAHEVDGKLHRLQDQDVVGAQRHFIIESIDLLHRNLQDLESVTQAGQHHEAEQQEDSLSPLPVLLSVVHATDGDKVMLSLPATSTIKEVFEALVDKLEHREKILAHGKLVQKVGERLDPLDAHDIVAQRRTLYFTGCELQRLPQAEIPFSVGSHRATIQVTIRKANDEHPGPHEVVLEVSADGTMQDVKEELARWLGRPELKHVVLLLLELQQVLQASVLSQTLWTARYSNIYIPDENFDEILDKIEICKSKKEANWEEESNELFAKGLTKVWSPTLVRRGFSPGEDGFQAMFSLVSAYGRRSAVRRVAFDLERVLRFKPGDFFGLPEETTGVSGRRGLDPEQAEELMSGILTLLKTRQFQGPIYRRVTGKEPGSSRKIGRGTQREAEPPMVSICVDDAPSELEKRCLTRQFFPSKVGGRPAWLIPEKLPEELTCSRCGCRLRFLMQISASQGSWKESCFHRMLHLFVCTNCQPNEARVFRAQLPRDCPYYSWDEPDREAVHLEAKDAELEALCCPDCGLPCEGGGSSPSGLRCGDCTRRARNGDPAVPFCEFEAAERRSVASGL
ncbi:unnamed protein product [Cladocopium goreaui]|uniref:Pre-mRNA-splicing factor SPF27 n=1 Tax=Cladocopium goreaui TaxID=2562237 RepID=A0A9P1CP23_9DINO|nr:unnamed protein product [Cladocopium goreaui]